MDWIERKGKKCHTLTLEDYETIVTSCYEDNSAKICGLACGTCLGVCFDINGIRFIDVGVTEKQKGCAWLRNPGNL